MKKLESSLTNMVVVLLGVAVVVGAILAFVNHVTEGPIEEQKRLALESGIKAVMQDDGVVITKEDIDTIKVDDGKGKELTYIIYNNKKGAAVESSTMGFGGRLRVLVGFDREGTILGYRLLEHQETPGLGAKADQWFQKGSKGNIIGMNPGTKPLDVKPEKGGKGDVDAITASTITTRAFLLAVNNAYNIYKKNAADAVSGATKKK